MISGSQDRALVAFHSDPPTHVTLPALEAIGVRHAFTTRHYGSFPPVSAPMGPFGGDVPGPVLRPLGVPGTAVRFARQVHGTTCVVADGRSPGLVGTGDALVTTNPMSPLAVFTADCLAVVLAEPARSALALAHVGWRGMVAGLLGRLIELLATRFEIRPDRLRAAIGPSIGPCCYEVDEPVVEPLRTAFPADWTRWVRPRGPDRWWLDLWQANTDQLVASGVPPDAVLNPRLCTACRQDLFFSYRKEGPGVRLAALAALDSTPC